MTLEEFRKHGHELVDWMTDYFKHVEEYPVKSQVVPGELLRKLPNRAPEEAEKMATIFGDFQKAILPGITHWQSPNFYAYFSANTSYPSILAEMLTATLGAQCMIWDTSPAAAELEQKVMEWLKRAMGLPRNWEGVIHDTASTATLISLLTAREQAVRYRINKTGFSEKDRFRIYCSTETHSSIDKAIRVMGIGESNLVKIKTDPNLRLDPALLKQQIAEDIKKGFLPLAVVVTLGTTGTTAVDPLDEIAAITTDFNCWLHVDAAYAGSALFLEEYRWMINGLDRGDSFVFNPHKWLFTNFDCSAYFVKDKAALIETFQILPEYLKTQSRGSVNDYRDWGIALGRRFRALKLWFVLRKFGLKQIRNTLRNHIAWAGKLADMIKAHPDFELLVNPLFNLVIFRFRPDQSSGKINAFNQRLLEKLNASGKMYLSHTMIDGKYALRMCLGQTYLSWPHIEKSWQEIQKMAAELR